MNVNVAVMVEFVKKRFFANKFNINLKGDMSILCSQLVSAAGIKISHYVTKQAGKKNILTFKLSLIRG